MAQYDPQRSRTRHRKADDEGPAPVDALLGPDPSVERVEPVSPAAASASAEPDLERLELERLEPETALDVARSLTSRGPAIWMATSAALVATVAMAWLMLRGRRRARRRARADATR
jgi:hypothetical protein